MPLLSQSFIRTSIRCYQNYIGFTKKVQKGLSEAFEKSIPKPTMFDGTRWINFKFQAMEKVLENYGPYMSFRAACPYQFTTKKT